MIIHVSIAQKNHGLEYHGEIKSISSKLKFNLKFGVPIYRLDEQVIPTKEEDLIKFTQKIFQFSLSKDGKVIEIDKELLRFLIQIVAQETINFYNNPQTRATNSGLLGAILDKTAIESDLVDMEIGMETSFNIPDEIIKERIPLLV